MKHFDFNEQPLGNFENLPMFWRRHGETGFPLFLEGRFDREAGHAAPPSFRLDLDGGSLAYHYQGRDISVRTNSDYLIVAWVKTRGLRHARAYLTAYYIDRKGNAIAGTECCSTLLGPEARDWQAVTLGLPGGVALSRYIGISLWLTQPDIRQSDPSKAEAEIRPTTHPVSHVIARQDVKATAWFDDITVYRLPRVALRTSHAGNIFQEDEPVELQAEVTDPDGLNLAARLVLRNAAGQEIDSRPVQIRSGSQVQTVTYTLLPPGKYQAELLVLTGSIVLVRREVCFARVSMPVSSPQSVGRGFGVILESLEPVCYAGQKQLLQYLHPGGVKLPVWSPRRMVREPETVHTIDRYVQAVIDIGGEPIGVIQDDGSAPLQEHPATAPGDQVETAVADDRLRGIMDVFSDDPAGWKPLIAGTWSRYAGLIHLWQVGQDGHVAVSRDPRLPDVVTALRREMGPLLSDPTLATCLSAHEPAHSAAEYCSIELPAAIPPEDICAHIAPLQTHSRTRTWAVVRPLSENGYPRALRAADLARRLAEAHFSKAEMVFMAAPWVCRADLISANVEPGEDLLVFRTVADVLGGATPVSRSVLAGRIQCLTFDRNDRAILCLWDPEAPASGREAILYLGEDAERVDLFGRRTPLRSVGRQQVVCIGPTPCFIINGPTWVLEFMRQFVMEPAHVEASLDVHERDIVFRNTSRQAISGLLRLTAPPDWDIRPNKLPFALQPGEVFRASVAIRFPLNAESGITALVGEFDIDAERRYHLLAPTWCELGLAGIDVEAYTYQAGDRTVIRQLMTNRTSETLNFDGYLLAPQRQRIERAFRNFQPGQTMSKDYVLEKAPELVNRKVRVGLKEVQGTRVWNRLITLP